MDTGDTWEYCTMEWVWQYATIRLNTTDGTEKKFGGAYPEIVSTLNALGQDGWEVVGSVAAGNWIFWTLKRRAG
ncbi:MAG TPA: hypothetical protein VFN11_12550 [Ktedonobacterales bacterium]|jgi:hypothetical protein|nr:hypothetical protein [Ktedonobacterales bacterium]